MAHTQTYLFYVVLGCIAMLIMAGFVVFFLLYYSQKQIKQRLAIQILEDTYQKQLLEVSLQVQEVERRRIAADLHDDIGTMLSAVRLGLGQTNKHLDSNTEARQCLNQTKDLLDEVMTNVRRISKELLPATLDSFGLLDALEEFTQKIKRNTSLNIQFIYEGTAQRFDKKTELSVYRIAQELINNSLKHAHASRIAINLACLNGHLILSVEDNGKGFEITSLPKHSEGGLGLKNIESRLSIINGSLRYDIDRGKGSSIVVDVPIAT